MDVDLVKEPGAKDLLKGSSIIAAIKGAGIEYVLNPYLVRGLDYYTRTVFEFYPTSAEGQQDTLASYKEQLSTTKMFYTPQEAVNFGASPELKQKMALVRQFCFDHGLLGAGTKSVDDVAIKYPDASVQGKADRVRLVFDAAYMQAAAAGKRSSRASAATCLLRLWPQ